MNHETRQKARRQTSTAAPFGLFALMNLAGGGIPAFSPDGSAGTIAGLDLGTSADRMFSLFALIGVNQIGVGLVAVHEVRRSRLDAR